jgi:hypothetical protein
MLRLRSISKQPVQSIRPLRGIDQDCSPVMLPGNISSSRILRPALFERTPMRPERLRLLKQKYVEDDPEFDSIGNALNLATR